MIDYDYINQLENRLVKENRHLNMIDIEETYQQAYGKAVIKALKYLHDTYELHLMPSFDEDFNKAMEG